MATTSLTQNPGPAMGLPGATTRYWRTDYILLVLFCAVALVATLPFLDALKFMYDNWLGMPEYSHGILVPLISGYLVWQRREELARCEFTGSAWGPVVVVLGFALGAMADMATVYPLMQYAYLVVFYGLVLSFTGVDVVRRIAMPLLILVFMVPLPQFIIAMMSGQLQLLSSALGVGMMRLLGVSVYLEGNVIDLGGYKLQVIEACDGLRYLFPLMTLGFITAYMYAAPLWARVVLFASSVPLTLVMNGLRVGAIGVMVDRWGPSMAEGLLHDVQGWMVFLASGAVMLGEVVLLNRLIGGKRDWREVFGLEWPSPPPADATLLARRLPRSFVVAAVAGTALAVAWVNLPDRPELVPERASLAEFPMTVGEFAGQRGALAPEHLGALQLDDYVIADYARPGSIAVNAYVAFYESQRKGNSVHSPRTCIPGGGWQLREFGQRTLRLGERGQGELRVNRAVVGMGDNQQLVYYWFKQRDRLITNEWLVKWYLFWDALTRNRTDGALVRLVTPMPPGTSPELADARLEQFAARLVPTLPAYVPD